ncbi:MAG: hypothetical protein R3351_01590 [Nitrospirales bacterium]|nr:hypothetical protein [Nitrospirales bacterium]
MSVDFRKEAHILAVHGVQLGEDESIKSEELVRKLVTKSLSQSHLEREFEVFGFFYEDINDQAQKFYKAIASAVSSSIPLAGSALKAVIDIAGDVVTASKGTSTAKKIRNKLKKEILRSYKDGHQLVVISHSLGTIYALDVINELIGKEEYYDGDDRNTWPVQGLITMGSPLGLEIEILGATLFEKRQIEPIAKAEFEVFPWHNYFNRLDPIVSGRVFGAPLKVKGARGPVEHRYGEDTKAAQWLLQGHAVTSGKQWLLAHTTYWKNPKVGDRLVDIIWG